MMKKYIIAVLMLLPLLLQLEYIITAWRDSPLNHWNWIYAGTALVLFGATAVQKPKALCRVRLLSAVSGIIFCLLTIFVGWQKSIHAVSIAGAMLLPLFGSGLFMDKKRFGELCPVFGILLLACPSMAYWLEIFSGISGFMTQAVIGVILLIIHGILRMNISFSKLEKPAFILCALLGFVLFFQKSVHNESAMPLLPRFSQLSRVNGYLGRQVDKTPNDRQFFTDCDIDRYFFVGDQLDSINILNVTRIGNIHKIHPTSYCLRSGGNTIESETTFTFQFKSRKYHINEVIVESDSKRYLYWTWYSNNTRSTSNFLELRANFHAQDHWQSFQIAIPLASPTTLDEQRRYMLEFLTAFLP